jgi:hypothetical protein
MNQARQRMGPVSSWGGKFFVDHADGAGRFSVLFGPADSLQEALDHFEATSATRTLRVRGPAGSAGGSAAVHAESHAGRRVYHSPPRRLLK